MLFANRVQVYNEAEKRMYSVKGDEAMELVTARKANILGEGKKCHAITLKRTSVAIIGPCRVPHVGQYMGTRYTHVEAVCNASGEVIAYKHDLNRLDASDHDLFCLSVTDNLRVAPIPQAPFITELIGCRA